MATLGSKPQRPLSVPAALTGATILPTKAAPGRSRQPLHCSKKAQETTRARVR